MGFKQTGEEKEMKDEVAIELLRACRAMLKAFTRHPGNNDEKHHALTLANKAVALWSNHGKD